MYLITGGMAHFRRAISTSPRLVPADTNDVLIPQDYKVQQVIAHENLYPINSEGLLRIDIRVAMVLRQQLPDICLQGRDHNNFLLSTY